MTNAAMTATYTHAFDIPRDGGWGPWIKVSVANTPEADAAAAAYVRKAGRSYPIQEAPDAELGPELFDALFPLCEHGGSLRLCAGPEHYPMDM